MRSEYDQAPDLRQSPQEAEDLVVLIPRIDEVT